MRSATAGFLRDPGGPGTAANLGVGSVPQPYQFLPRTLKAGDRLGNGNLVAIVEHMPQRKQDLPLATCWMFWYALQRTCLHERTRGSTITSFEDILSSLPRLGVSAAIQKAQTVRAPLQPCLSVAGARRNKVTPLS